MRRGLQVEPIINASFVQPEWGVRKKAKGLAERCMSPSPWLLLAPLLTGASMGFFVAVLLERDDPVRFFALLAGALLALFLRTRLGRPGARARILSGNFPFGCFRAPKTPEGFAQQLYETWIATGQRPTVVGSGWEWFIGRAHARNAVFTHKLKGRIGEFTFLAGTELRDVEAAIRKAHGRTFWSTPTMQRISIGSWLGRSCRCGHALRRILHAHEAPRKQDRRVAEGDVASPPSVPGRLHESHGRSLRPQKPKPATTGSWTSA